MTADRVLLDMTVPLMEAVGASDREAWSEAADLWFDVDRDERCRVLATPCGAEAALHAGLFDLAEYFRAGLAELPAVPGFIARLFEDAAPTREARKRYYMRRIARAGAQAGSAENATAQELLRLQFFPEAIRLLLTGEPYRRDLPAAAPLLARAYWLMGAHGAFIALVETRAADISDPDLEVKVARARRMEARLADPPTAVARRFQAAHPAGPTLAALLAQTASAVV